MSLEGGVRLASGSHSRRLAIDDRLLSFEPPCFTRNVTRTKGASGCMQQGLGLLSSGRRCPPHRASASP